MEKKLRLSMLLMLGIGVLQLSCAGSEDLDARTKGKCKNPNGKIDQLKNLGCKSAVCSKGEGGKMFWKECRQPATEEKQIEMIDIQTATQEKVNEINNKQTRVLERQNQMIGIQTATQENVDQINNKQTRVLEKQDKMIDIQTVTHEKVDQINNKQTRVIERQDKMISLLERICGPICNVPVVFHKAEEFTITRNNKLGELSVLHRQFIIRFQLFITAPSTANALNIIQFTIGGKYGKYGDRVPAILVWQGSELAVRSAISGNHDYYAPDTTPDIALNTWHDIEVAQLAFENEVYFSFKIDGATYANVKNTDAREFKNVKMYAGNPFENPCNGKIRNFEVKTMA